jgi:hypothetical protein
VQLHVWRTVGHLKMSLPLSSQVLFLVLQHERFGSSSPLRVQLCVGRGGGRLCENSINNQITRNGNSVCPQSRLLCGQTLHISHLLYQKVAKMQNLRKSRTFGTSLKCSAFIDRH